MCRCARTELYEPARTRGVTHFVGVHGNTSMKDTNTHVRTHRRAESHLSIAYKFACFFIYFWCEKAPGPNCKGTHLVKGIAQAHHVQHTLSMSPTRAKLPRAVVSRCICRFVERASRTLLKFYHTVLVHILQKLQCTIFTNVM